MSKLFTIQIPSIGYAAWAFKALADMDEIRAKISMLVSIEDTDKLCEWAKDRAYNGVNSYIDCLRIAYDKLLEGKTVEEITQ